MSDRNPESDRISSDYRDSNRNMIGSDCRNDSPGKIRKTHVVNISLKYSGEVLQSVTS